MFFEDLGEEELVSSIIGVTLDSPPHLDLFQRA